MQAKVHTKVTKVTVVTVVTRNAGNGIEPQKARNINHAKHVARFGMALRTWDVDAS